jgi:tetratricopeptide (TPR) repeat protein
LDRLSGLPLALTQAAAYIDQAAVSIFQYLEYYDSMWKALMEQQDEYPLQEYAQRSVLTTWRISYEQVKIQSEDASNLLQLWSFLYASDLWYELISCTEELGTKHVVPDWITVLAKDRFRFDRALRLLKKYSLVEGKTDTTSYTMHSVLHSWCRYLGASEAERDSFQKLALKIVGWMVPLKSTKEYWILQRRLLPHGQAVFDVMKSKTQAEINVDEIWACNDLTSMFEDQDRYLEAEAMYERALPASEKAFGPTDPSTLTIVSNLGNLYTDQCRPVEAEAMYKRALAGREKVLGPTHTSTLHIVNNLGNLYCKLGRLPESEAMLKRALAGQEKALGPEHTSTLTTINNLGNLYSDQGRLVEAEAMYKRAQAGSEKVLGLEHTFTLDIANNLGYLYYKQGRLIEAEAMYDQALAGQEKALRSEHMSTLQIICNLGILYHDQGRLAKAEAMFERALAGKEKAFGSEHLTTLSIVNSLGMVYRKQGRLLEAEAMFERALAGQEKAFKPEQTSTPEIASDPADLDHGWGGSLKRKRSTGEDS